MKRFLMKIPIMLFITINLCVPCSKSMAETISENTNKVKINCKSPWTIVGIIEELRSYGIKIPVRLEEIEQEICFKLNIPSFF